MVAFNIMRIIIFLGAIVLVLFAGFFALLGFKGMTIQHWINYGKLLLMPLFLLFISIFPKYASRVLFCWAAEEKRLLFMTRLVTVVAVLVAINLIFFLGLLLSGQLLRGLAEI